MRFCLQLQFYVVVSLINSITVRVILVFYKIGEIAIYKQIKFYIRWEVFA